MSGVSVVLPVYNSSAKLPEVIASIGAQTFGAYEVIAVDDGSTDGSAGILDDWARRDGRVRVVRHRVNRHLANALNTGLREARGSLIIRADDDDINVSERFARLVAAAEKHPQMAVIGSAAWSGGRVERFPASTEAIRARMLWECPFLHPTVLLNRRVLGEVTYDPDFSGIEDLELWLRTVFRQPTMNLREPLLHYRPSAGSVSRVIDEARLRMHHAYDRRVADLLGLPYIPGAGLACRLGIRVAQVPAARITGYVLAVARRAAEQNLAPLSLLRREVLWQGWRLWRYHGHGRMVADFPGLVAATARLGRGWRLR